MALKGDFNTFFISNILQLLAAENKTGTLRISDGKRQIEIIIKDGYIIYALGARIEFKLGNIIKNKNIITTEQLENALREGKKNNLALGTILVQKKIISNDNLEAFIRMQVEEIMYDIFLWEKGEFEYKDAKLNLDRVIVSKLDVTRVLLEAARRIDEMTVFKKHIQNGDIVFRISERINLTDKIKPSQNETQILSLIDGNKTVRQLIESTYLDQFTLYKTLYSLISSGIIEACITNPTDQTLYSSLIKGYNDILHIIFKNVEKIIGDKATVIFKENKPIIQPEKKNVIRNFDHKISVSENIDFILNEMKNFNNLEEGFTVLTDAFNMYILNILGIIPEMIGTDQTRILLRDVDLLLLYIGRLQRLSDDKIKIVSDVEFIIQKVRQKLKN